LLSIAIFNSIPIERFDPGEIHSAVTESNLYVLCDQYGLDSAWIETSMAYLDVQVPKLGQVPFFTLQYTPEPAVPIVVNCWRDVERVSSFIRLFSTNAPNDIQDHLALTREVFGIELSYLQCHDLGILFAYELTRWIAFKGEGVVRALDGEWYRLNTDKAFLPVKNRK